MTESYFSSFKNERVRHASYAELSAAVIENSNVLFNRRPYLD
jgi:hypothetical protein